MKSIWCHLGKEQSSGCGCLCWNACQTYFWCVCLDYGQACLQVSCLCARKASLRPWDIRCYHVPPCKQWLFLWILIRTYSSRAYCSKRPSCEHACKWSCFTCLCITTDFIYDLLWVQFLHLKGTWSSEFPISVEAVEWGVSLCPAWPSTLCSVLCLVFLSCGAFVGAGLCRGKDTTGLGFESRLSVWPCNFEQGTYISWTSVSSSLKWE